MIGAAIGDAIGKQNEGLKREEIIERKLITDYGAAPPGSPGEKLNAGQYTDDTEEMLVLAQSLIDCNGFDPDDFSKKIAQWGKSMKYDPARSGLLGPSSSYAIDNLNAGVSWKESGSDVPSCGSAMRAAPIGLFFEDFDEVEEKAVLSSIPTHKSKSSIAGTVAVAVGIRSAVNGMDISEIIEQTCEKASRHDPELAEKIRLSYDLRDGAPDVVFSKVGTSFYVYDTVPSAFYCFSKHFNDPEKVIIEAVNAGGDTDSIGCIAGALCGAFHGIKCFPEKWMNGLQNMEFIRKTALILYRKKRP